MAKRTSKAKLSKLAAEIAEHDASRRAARKFGTVDESKLTPGEKSFTVLADQRGKDVYRGGWPSFVAVDRATGATVCVEVKEPWDAITEAQLVMFTALEAASVSIMIWQPHRPAVLTPWRMYLREQLVRPQRVPVLLIRSAKVSRERSPEEPNFGTDGQAGSLTQPAESGPNPGSGVPIPDHHPSGSGPKAAKKP